MSGRIAVDKLNPHPKNDYYFTDVTGEKYEEIKRSIEVYGIRDPLKVTTSYTVISGHQRLRIAHDLGLQEVPVEIIDVDEWQAEYMLIAENVERRGQAETDPIKKARIAQFLKEYWGVKNGTNQYDRVRHNGGGKTVTDVAETIGENRRTTERLMKLNDLIPPLQSLVSSGKLGTTAAEQLAYLSPEVQRELLDAELVEGTTVARAKEYREITKNDPSEVATLKKRVAELESREIPEEVEEELRRLKREKAEMDDSLTQTYARIRELERLERSVTSERENPLYDIMRSSVATSGYLKLIAEQEVYSRDLYLSLEQEKRYALRHELKKLKMLVDRVIDITSDEEVKIIEGVIEYGN